MRNNQLELGQESIGKLLLKYSVPAIIITFKIFSSSHYRNDGKCSL